MGRLVVIQSNRGDLNSNPVNLASAFARCSTGGTAAYADITAAVRTGPFPAVAYSST
jgi:hypothetical protein